ncbi:hypothetical protein HUU53_03980 [Candidatus Micrarchaeota archaeon]|nr:hypothetical protein [Candidatus Micrarchaeota archaeon]
MASEDFISQGCKALKIEHKFTEEDLIALKKSHNSVILALLGNDFRLYQLASRGKYNLPMVKSTIEDSLKSASEKEPYELALELNNNLFEAAAAIKDLSSRRNY